MTEQAVAVLVGATLPGAVGVAEVDAICVSMVNCACSAISFTLGDPPLDLDVVFVAQSPSMVCSSTLHLAFPESVTRIIAKMLRRSHETAPPCPDTCLGRNRTDGRKDQTDSRPHRVVRVYLLAAGGVSTVEGA